MTRQQARHGTPAIEKMRAKLERRGPCLVWTGWVDRDGYGHVSLPREKRNRRVHVIAWEEVNGPVPEGMEICHTCDNPPCCEPLHLFLGTSQDNQTDKVAKDRHAKGSVVGTSKLTEEIVRAIRAEYVPYRVPARVLAERYGVAKVTVDRILQGKAWTHV